MPWKECHVMDERLRFVARLLEGEKMAPLCAEFGISRKTGYKIFDRYKDCGVAGLQRSESPAAPAGESAAGADRGDDRPPEARVSGLGRAEDSREAAPAVHRTRTCRRSARSTRCWIGTASCTVVDGAGGRATGTALSRPTDAECALVRRLQRRVHARESPILLSADDHRLRQSVPADL